MTRRIIHAAIWAIAMMAVFYAAMRGVLALGEMM